ncbi:ABC transporter permease [Paraburkholderia hospita]|uniref:ABC transporter permease n=1 Tax=Paraburkholderia hospita TaxID=169430 RepID=UPI0009D5E74A|nr:ABC transporter permease [Paraburkholderia hospita]SKD04426.1 ABC-type spermidine/putrescine transport system, permease component I [Paraburkholderia hospita]
MAASAKQIGRSSPSSGDSYGSLSSLLLLSPFLVLLIVAFVYPVGKLLLTSVFSHGLTFEHYEHAASGLYVRVFVRTFVIAFTVACITGLLGYPVAWLLTRVKGKAAFLMTVCILIPMWTSVLVRSYSWIVLLQRNGIVNEVLLSTGVINEPLKLIYNQGAVIMAMVHVLLPYMILPVYGALKAIPVDLSRASANLGASSARTFATVTLPLSMPGVYAGSLIVFVLALGFYVTPALVGGPSTLLIATLIGQQVTQTFNWPFAAALSTLLLFATVAVTVVFRRFVSFSGRL